MAMPPSPMPGAPPAPPPAAMGGAPPDDMAGTEDAGAGEPEVVATILKNPDGKYALQIGDEPEEPGMGEEGGAPPEAPKTFDSPQELVRALLPLLNGTDAAEAAFVGAGKGGMGGPPPGGPKPPPMGM